MARSSASTSKVPPASPKKAKTSSLKAQLARQQPDGAQQTSLNRFFTSPGKAKAKASEVIEIDSDSSDGSEGKKPLVTAAGSDAGSDVEIVSATTTASQADATPAEDPWAELREMGKASKDSDLKSNGLLGPPIDPVPAASTFKKRKRQQADDSAAPASTRAPTAKSESPDPPMASSSKMGKLIGLESLSAERKTVEPIVDQVKSEPVLTDDDIKPDLKPVTAEMIAETDTSAGKPYGGIDWDVDSLVFRPESVDIRKWPAGRLPYEVLVGVYVQVGATRSRLAIVRIITKYVSTSCKSGRS